MVQNTDREDSSRDCALKYGRLNSKLKVRDLEINNLVGDLSDGVSVPFDP